MLVYHILQLVQLLNNLLLIEIYMKPYLIVTEAKNILVEFNCTLTF